MPALILAALSAIGDIASAIGKWIGWKQTQADRSAGAAIQQSADGRKALTEASQAKATDDAIQDMDFDQLVARERLRQSGHPSGKP